MRIFTSFLLVLLFPVMLFSQKSELLKQHYQNEFNTFREAIERSESMNPDTSINVTFYHLTLDISALNPGLYIVKIVDAESVFSAKFVKM